jgi:hydrogenase-4 component B
LVALLFAAMLAVFTSGDAVGFVFTWEIAALLTWSLVTFDCRNERAVDAGYLTLALSELGTVAGMVGLFVLLAGAGSASLSALGRSATNIPPGLAVAGFLLTFYGFGVKAGIAPLNSWLPPAHSAAPRSISPLLSGATLNLGVFAVIIIDGPLAGHVPGFGLLMLASGAATALIGIVYAMLEGDLKRLLAQSSVENLGITVAALGAGFTFIAFGRPLAGGIALVAGLYHMLNHSTYKTLLFLGVGAVDEATGTHELNRLGGLARRLPVLSVLFLTGALAIASLPPFNGFVSEWLTLESMLRVVEVAPVAARIVFALSAAALALTAGLALTCFIMAFSSTFLGLPQSSAAAQPRPVSRSALVPMGVLAAACLVLGVLATAVIPVLAGLVRPYTGVDATPALVPAFFQAGTVVPPEGVSADLVHALTPIGAQVGRGIVPLRGLVVLHPGGAQTPVVFAMSTALTFIVLAGLLAATWLIFRAWGRRRTVRGDPWGGGLHRLRPEMGYTANAFASPVRVLFDAVLRPAVAEHTEQQGAFTTAIRRRPRMVHIIDRLTLKPAVGAMRAMATLLAGMHRGPVTDYAAYILVAAVVALLLGRFAI